MAQARIKYLIELGELKFSGAEIITEQQARFFKERGIKAHILSIGEQKGVYFQKLERAGYTMHHIPHSLRFKFLKRYFLFLRKERFDVVHIHLEHMSFWVLIVSKLAGVKKLVRTYHACFPYKGFLRVSVVVKRWVERHILGVTSYACSQGVQDTERRRYKNPCGLINNGVDIIRFKPVSLVERRMLRKKLNIDQDAFVILVVGRFTMVKRYEDAIQLMHKLKLSSLRSNEVLYLFGDGPTRDKLKKLALKLCVEDHVYFMGNQPNVDEYYKAADLYLMSSSTEGLSIAFLEAMASALPCVVTEIPEFKNIVTNGTTALMYPVSDVNQLQERIERLICSKKLQSKLGRAAREEVIMKYSIEKMTEDLCALLTRKR